MNNHQANIERFPLHVKPHTFVESEVKHDDDEDSLPMIEFIAVELDAEKDM